MLFNVSQMRCECIHGDLVPVHGVVLCKEAIDMYDTYLVEASHFFQWPMPSDARQVSATLMTGPVAMYIFE